LDGRDLGANLALEVAAAHPELAGAVLESPLDSPVNALFSDPRARLVPARLLVSDRFNADKAANALLIPSLWLIAPPGSSKIGDQRSQPNGFDRITARKTLASLPPGSSELGANGDQVFAQAFARWLDDLPGGTGAR
jgi:pimeloyl-ACP methyl ester carboxylesterase